MPAMEPELNSDDEEGVTGVAEVNRDEDEYDDSDEEDEKADNDGKTAEDVAVDDTRAVRAEPEELLEEAERVTTTASTTNA